MNRLAGRIAIKGPAWREKKGVLTYTSDLCGPAVRRIRPKQNPFEEGNVP